MDQVAQRASRATNRRQTPESPEQKSKINRIVVQANGDTYLDDEKVTVPALKEKLIQKKAAEPELGVVVKGSDDVEFQHMVNVLDLTKVGLATDAATQPK